MINILAIKKIFPESKNNLCAWHIQQGLKKRFAYLNKGNNKQKKKIYNKIIMLPLADYPGKFEEDLEFILQSEFLKVEEKKYLETKSLFKEKWVKGYMKTDFCSGMFTSSRIEAMHRVMKRFLRSSTQLTELFQVFKELEEKEIYKFKDEIQRYQKKENKKLEESELFKHFKGLYSEYALNKLKDQLIESVNYKLFKKEDGVWYSFR